MSNLQQFDQLKADITLKLSPALQLKVTDEDSMNKAQLAGKEVKHFHKLIETKRKELVKPLNDQVDAINLYSKKILEPVAQVETHLKGQLASYEKVLEQKRIEEQKKLDEQRKIKEEELAQKAREEKERAEMEAMFGIASEDDVVRQQIVSNAQLEREQSQLLKETKTQAKAIAATKVSGARKVWKFTVQDAEQVPREFLSVDEKKIREAVNAGVREIPGVQIFQDTSISLR